MEEKTIQLRVKIRIKKETKKHTTFYLRVNNSQSTMTLTHKDFAAFCGLITKGQIGMPLDKIEFAKCCALEWIK